MWGVVVDVLLTPENVLATLDQMLSSQENTQHLAQIDFLQRQIAASHADEQRLWRAYSADVFDEYEYAAQRKALKEKRVVSKDEIDRQKAYILAVAEKARENGIAKDAPFLVKQRVLKTLVDKIILNVNEWWVEIVGVINGRWDISGGDGSENYPSCVHPCRQGCTQYNILIRYQGVSEGANVLSVEQGQFLVFLKPQGFP